MILTIILTMGMMLLLFLMIWSATVTLPYKGLAKNFPADVQEKLEPRLNNLPMSGKRILGWVFLIIFVGEKAFDIIGLDFFLLTKTHFFQHYFPETEGCAGWKNFGYNRKEQIKQCIIIPIFCLIIAWFFSLIG